MDLTKKPTHLCVYILKLLIDSPLEVSKKLLSSSRFEKTKQIHKEI